MNSWIAREHDETGGPTESCLIVSAHTQAEAKQVMSSAIDARSTTATRKIRERLYAIFIEAPRELAADDPRQQLITDSAAPTFLGFDHDPPNRSRQTPRR